MIKKTIIIAIFLASIFVSPIWADDISLPDKVIGDTRPALESFNSAIEKTSRQKELIAYKKILENLSLEKIRNEVAAYDPKGNLTQLQFSDNTTALYSYSYNTDSRLESVTIKYDGIKFTLFTKTGEYTLTFTNTNPIELPPGTQNLTTGEDQDSENSGETKENPEGQTNPPQDKEYITIENQINENNGGPFIINNEDTPSDIIFRGSPTDRINPRNLRLNFPALRDAFNSFLDNKNLLLNSLDKTVDSYYDNLYSELKENLEFWLENLNDSSLESKIKNNSLSESELRKIIDETIKKLSEKASTGNTNQSLEYLDILTIEKELRLKLEADINSYEVRLQELLDKFYETISQILKEQDMPVIADNSDELNILISLPNLAIEPDKGEFTQK